MRRDWMLSRPVVGTCLLLLSSLVIVTWTCPGPGSTSQAVAQGLEEETAPAGETSPPPAKQSYLGWMFEALGIEYTVVFLSISFTFVALMVMNLMATRRDNICPASLIDRFESLLNDKKYQEAYDLAKGHESFLGQVLSAGLAKLSAGYARAIEAMQEVGEEENMKLEHRMGYIALIGTVSPMIGLFGTVDGMIRSFNVIANSDTTPKPSDLAKGVSTALFTTLIGLLIAIPAVAFYNLVRNRIARLVLEAGIVSENLMSRFDNVQGQRKEG